jgi:hypothetical protein
MGFLNPRRVAMVKRVKQEDMAGALELEGIGKDDPGLQQWLEEHRGRNGGKLRVGLGGTGVRISREADLSYWRQHYQPQKARAAV